jgi:NADH-quinone oxidoreductase subunit J
VDAQNISFGIIAAMMVIAALRVVSTPDVVHAALYLVVVLAGVAALFVLLAAEFTAATQVIVYIGAIVVLFLFGVMLTRAPIGGESGLDNPNRWVAALPAVMVLAVLVNVQAKAFGRQKLDITRVQRSGEVGQAIFSTYLVPFEVISVLLLAALVGAVVLARRD